MRTLNKGLAVSTFLLAQAVAALGGHAALAASPSDRTVSPAGHAVVHDQLAMGANQDSDDQAQWPTSPSDGE